MSLVPFVFADVADGVARIAADDEHHLRRVLRLGEGAPLVVADGAGRTWPGVLAGAGAAELTGPPTEHAPPRPGLHVVQALAKGRKVDDVVQALVEVGVERITPVAAARSVVRLEGDKAQRARERWQAVARAAAAQARRPFLPVVESLATIDRLPALTGVLAHVGAAQALAPVVEALAGAEEVTVAVGPEGGWTNEEAEALVARGLVAVHLGPSVLRTEHAALAACAALALALGRWDRT